ncbi:hypothetical protein ACFFX0_26655 [Citricoccus parietis]|uniref:Uncharacterized protein n=1 Tax=Citricoccus parietis TaxID=592307 RepID=A0ABV5G6J3_9MICC
MTNRLHENHSQYRCEFIFFFQPCTHRPPWSAEHHRQERQREPAHTQHHEGGAQGQAHAGRRCAALEPQH